MQTVTDWEKRYQENKTGWDIGHISTPLKEYFDQLKDKSLKILIPGGGNGYEASYLFENGFTAVHLLDIVSSPLENFSAKHPDFPQTQLIQANFFDHQGQYDLIVEQTFFCAINRSHRADYAKKVHDLLKPKGKLVGLLWAQEMQPEGLPYGGTKDEYTDYFDPYFDYTVFDIAYNSIPPRKNKELFLLAQKKA